MLHQDHQFWLFLKAFQFVMDQMVSLELTVLLLDIIQENLRELHTPLQDHQFLPLLKNIQFATEEMELLAMTVSILVLEVSIQENLMEHLMLLLDHLYWLFLKVFLNVMVPMVL